MFKFLLIILLIAPFNISRSDEAQNFKTKELITITDSEPRDYWVPFTILISNIDLTANTKFCNFKKGMLFWSEINTLQDSIFNKFKLFIIKNNTFNFKNTSSNENQFYIEICENNSISLGYYIVGKKNVVEFFTKLRVEYEKYNFVKSSVEDLNNIIKLYSEKKD